ncbi:MAG: hypothetical protein H8E40_00260 [Chloroflexi bacterium]|nr:hypothetical protein [Chloroflexota bacterium]
MLNDQEKRVLELLADAYNLFLELEERHPCDAQEFMQAIHVAQNIVLARAALRGSITTTSLGHSVG